MNQKIIILLLLFTGWRFFIALQDSYIHPDEHFQSFNVVNSILSSSSNKDLPWEFTSTRPARSLAAIFAVYYPFFSSWGNTLASTPIQKLYLARLAFLLASWVSMDCILIKLSTVSTRKNLTSMTLLYTSYVVAVFQSHTFSNSVETVVLLWCLYTINTLKTQMENHEYVQLDRKKNAEQYHASSGSLGTVPNNFGSLALLALVVSFGLFNRITFAAFLVLPAWYLAKFFICYKKFLSFAVFLISGVVCCLGLAYADTLLYEFLQAMLYPTTKYQYTLSIFRQPLIIAPLNNLIYNSNYSNLAKHGIHPRYTHLTVNLIQMLGPLYLVFLLNLKRFFSFLRVNFDLRHASYATYNRLQSQNDQFGQLSSQCVIYLSILSGLLFLSVIPHQELRFLLPLQPLILKIIDFEDLNEKFEAKKGQKTGGSDSTSKKPSAFVIITPRAKALVRNILYAWYVFNIALGILMGVFHQGGVIPVLEHLRESNKLDNTIQIWWRTYPPPTWLLGNLSVTLKKYDDQIKALGMDVEFTDNLDTLLSYNYSTTKGITVVDTMGMEINRLEKVLEETVRTCKPTLLICPISSFNRVVQKHYQKIDSFQFEEQWSYFYHLDMDHLNFPNLQPGIGIYRVRQQ